MCKNACGNALPDVEYVSRLVHADWMKNKRLNGIESRIFDQTGEELMVDYDLLSEEAKQIDRNTVITVYSAIKEARDRAEDQEKATIQGHWRA